MTWSDDLASAGIPGMGSSLLTTLHPETATALRAAGRTVRYPVDAALMLRQQPGESVHVLLEGHVKIVAPSGGRDTLLGFRGPGDLLGEMAAVQEGHERAGTVIALEPVTSLIVPGSTFRSLVHQRPDLALVVIGTLADRLRDADLKRAEFAELDATGRVASRLCELTDRFGRPDADGRAVRVGLSITQAELAGWAATSLESAVRALSQLRSLGWISTERRLIVVHELEALRGRAGS